MKNFITLYESRQKAIKLFNDYSKIVSNAKYKSTYEEGLPLDLAAELKIITPGQMLQRYQ